MLTVSAVLVLLLSPAQDSPKKKLLTQETFMEMESVGSPSISPDGTKVLFTRGWIDQQKDEHRGNLWLVDADGGRVRELATGKWKDSSPAWSADGKPTPFLTDRKGPDLDPLVSPDGRWIAYVGHDERGFTYHLNSLYLMDKDGGQKRT